MIDNEGTFEPTTVESTTRIIDHIQMTTQSIDRACSKHGTYTAAQTINTKTGYVYTETPCKQCKHSDWKNKNRLVAYDLQQHIPKKKTTNNDASKHNQRKTQSNIRTKKVTVECGKHGLSFAYCIFDVKTGFVYDMSDCVRCECDDG